MNLKNVLLDKVIQLLVVSGIALAFKFIINIDWSDVVYFIVGIFGFLVFAFLYEVNKFRKRKPSVDLLYKDKDVKVTIQANFNEFKEVFFGEVGIGQFFWKIDTHSKCIKISETQGEIYGIETSKFKLEKRNLVEILK